MSGPGSRRRRRVVSVGGACVGERCAISRGAARKVMSRAKSKWIARAGALARGLAHP